MNKIIQKITSVVGILSILSGIFVQPALASTVVWNVGDVFAGVGGGTYNIYDNSGVSKDTISDGLGGFTTGCSFNGTLDKLYTTNFSNTKVEVYDNAVPHTLSQTIDTAVNGGASSESVVFASNGDFYVGHADGNHQLQKFNAAGIFQLAYAAAIENRGTDWNDLASDQKTMFYTSEGTHVKRFDVSTSTQLTDFNTVALLGVNAYALRLLPPGDGTGGLLVADSADIKRLDGTGAVVQSYDAPGEDSWFALNLDPNGTSFWAGDFGTNNFYRFNIASGVVEVGPIASGGSLFGLCVKGELTAAKPLPGTMTGGGSVFTADGKRVTHGFELQCDKSKNPNSLEVNWGGNRFHLESLTSAACTDDPTIKPNPPAAGFDTYVGKGTGRYNGVTGATAEWTFTDAGEPGKNDTAKLVIKDAGSNVVLSVSGNLKSGNQQAH